MEEDYPDRNYDKKVPILDMKVWMDRDDFVVYQHYEKPVTSKQVLAAQSAHSSSCKRSVHVSEVSRRILNTSGRLDWDTYTAPVLTDYMNRMREAGYNENYRKTVLVRALAKYDKMLKNEKDGVQPMNRPKDWNKDERRLTKRGKRHSWSTRGGYIAPIIIPSTPNGELLTMLRQVEEAEAEPGLRFKILENGGTKIKNIVQVSNPTASPLCQSGDCLACRGGGVGLCRKSNVQYQMDCNLCPEDKKWSYIGETARNLYSRSKEHVKNYEKKKKEGESFMGRHSDEKHHGVEANFSARVTGVFRDCLSRQVSEGVSIRRCQNEVLNSKAEWHQPALWRVRSEITKD